VPKKPANAGAKDNLYKHDNGNWYARYWIKGREFRKSLRTANETEARKKLKLLLGKVDLHREALSGLAGDSLLWEDAVGRYLLEVGKSRKAKTQMRYGVSFRQVSDYLEGKHLDQISTKVINDLVADRKLDEVSNATINRDLTAISQVLACGIAWGVCRENPARTFNRRLLTQEARMPREIPTDEQIRQVVARCPGLFAAAALFARRTGARQEEVFSLEWPDLDLAAGAASFLKTKTSRPRTIVLSPEALGVLHSLPHHPRTKFVFWHGGGDRYANVSSRFLEIRSQLMKDNPGFPDFTFHDLRHAYAVAELKAGRDIYDLARHLGHTSVKTTEKYLGYVPGGAPVSRAA
jgi:integrase